MKNFTVAGLEKIKRDFNKRWKDEAELVITNINQRGIICWTITEKSCCLNFFKDVRTIDRDLDSWVSGILYGDSKKKRINRFTRALMNNIRKEKLEIGL